MKFINPGAWLRDFFVMRIKIVRFPSYKKICSPGDAHLEDKWETVKI